MSDDLIERLGPCPFCGGKKFHLNTKAKGYFIKKQAEREKRDTSNYLVRCTKCGAKGPLRHSPQEAADAWSARAALVAKDAEIARLREALERLKRNFDLLLAGEPVRDVAETEAEVVAALHHGENNG